VSLFAVKAQALSQKVGSREKRSATLVFPLFADSRCAEVRCADSRCAEVRGAASRCAEVAVSLLDVPPFDVPKSLFRFSMCRFSVCRFSMGLTMKDRDVEVVSAPRRASVQQQMSADIQAGPLSAITVTLGQSMSIMPHASRTSPT
jgi:hypothetical protein